MCTVDASLASEKTGHHLYRPLVSGCFLYACLYSGYMHLVSLPKWWKYFSHFLREGDLRKILVLLSSV